MLKKGVLCARRILMLLVIAATLAYSQDTSQPFAISIKTRTAKFVSGEPIRLDISLVNDTPNLVILPDMRICPVDAGLTVLDRKESPIAPRESATNPRYHVGSRFGMAIAPHKRLQISVSVDTWFDVSAPGQYTLQVRKKVPGIDTVVESNKLTIIVLPKTD